MVAHRLSTIRNAHKILVINQGKLVEEGTHEELMEKGGLYQHLQEVQTAKNRQGAVEDQPLLSNAVEEI